MCCAGCSRAGSVSFPLPATPATHPCALSACSPFLPLSPSHSRPLRRSLRRLPPPQLPLALRPGGSHLDTAPADQGCQGQAAGPVRALVCAGHSAGLQRCAGRAAQGSALHGLPGGGLLWQGAGCMAAAVWSCRSSACSRVLTNARLVPGRLAPGRLWRADHSRRHSQASVLGAWGRLPERLGCPPSHMKQL